jgi:hypothetical protein
MIPKKQTTYDTSPGAMMGELVWDQPSCAKAFADRDNNRIEDKAIAANFFFINKNAS